jgi:hypothetical protein
MQKPFEYGPVGDEAGALGRQALTRRSRRASATPEPAVFAFVASRRPGRAFNAPTALARIYRPLGFQMVCECERGLAWYSSPLIHQVHEPESSERDYFRYWWTTLQGPVRVGTRPGSVCR